MIAHYQLDRFFRGAFSTRIIWPEEIFHALRKYEEGSNKEKKKKESEKLDSQL